MTTLVTGATSGLGRNAATYLAARGQCVRGTGRNPRAGEADFIVAKHRNGPTRTITVAFQGHFSRFQDMAPA